MKINGRTVYVTSFTDDGAWVRDPYTGEEWFDSIEQCNKRILKITLDVDSDSCHNLGTVKETRNEVSEDV